MHDLALHSTAGTDAGGAGSLFGLSLCAGAGGLDLGLMLAEPGYRTVGYVERDAFAAAVLVARMEDEALDPAPVWDDVATFDGRPWRGAVDVLTAGYPCQPFSVAGRRAGVPTIPGTCGRTLPGSSKNARPNGCSSKTSPIISTSDIARSEASWKAWASGLRKDCSRRLKSARRTGASACSSWPTPNVGGGGNPPEILTAKCNHFVRPSGKKAHLGLDQAARMWPTPRACSGRRSSGGNRTELVRAWATPKACDGVKPSAGKRRNADLPHQARDWATPAARDWRSGKASEKTLSRNSRPLNEQAVCRPFLPDREIRKAGVDTSPADLTLNPLFVEVLMGWPPGWTNVRAGGGSLNIAWTGFGSAATEWSLWLRRMRGELSALASTPMEAEAA